MALASDLVQIGFSPQQADFLGDTFASVNAAGNASQTDAAAITASINAVTATAVLNGVRLPTRASFKGSRIVIRNTASGFNLNVYPASGEAIAGAATDAAIVLATSVNVAFYLHPTSTLWIPI